MALSEIKSPLIDVTHIDICISGQNMNTLNNQLVPIRYSDS